MDCKACGESIPEDSEFCERCASSVSPAEEADRFEFAAEDLCRRCGEPLPEDARFCPRCGEPLSVGPGRAERPAPAGGALESDALRQERDAALKLPYVHWFLVLVYSLITLGLYQPVWFLRRRWGLDALNERLRISAGAMWFSLVYLFFSLVVSLGMGFLDGLMQGAGAWRGLEALGMAQGAFSVADGILSLVVLVLLLAQAFRVRRILLEHFQRVGRDIKVRWLWTFLLTIIYLQHKLNRGVIEPHMEE